MLMVSRVGRWDAENRLVGIGYVDHPEKKSSFQYDGLNRRAVMVETHGSESTTSTFLWDGTDLLRVQTGSAMKWYYPQGEIHGTESLFYVSDRLGSVRETVNQDHLITARMSYTAYGETQTTLTPFIGKAPDYRYAGLFFHEQSGLYLAVFRAYDPSAGRWISRDPIGEDGGVNLYAYSKSVPINNNDSLGLSPNLSGFAKYELHKAIKFCAQPKNWISKELVSRVPGLQCFSELILAGQNKKRIRQECIAASTNPKSRFYGHPQSCEIIRPYSTFEGCIKFASTYGITDGGGK
ncbi:RHS repeat-associated core domain-containing protein [Acidithiobacillus sp. VAN18-2]|jgi:RHS repeat-associated protein|nr:RHS repeat-associated core domain-containing protein [Acidithiobacillus sp. VAN18-2]MBU2796628.1 RHS repeat-associated core domain-containing protein [Acidithiobacillus sp. VAN18-2]MBU2797572.1 RHS repeat-associated core domain-containing protein [Acidithiobacillus sp. VAN18-2]